MNRRNFVMATLFAAILAACSASEDGQRFCLSGDCPSSGGKDGGGLQSNTMSCSALSPGSVQSGSIASIAIQVAGGEAPYFVNGNSFIQSTTVNRVYTATSDTLLIQDQIVVQDSNGSSINCPYQIVVYPSGSVGTGGLGCAIHSSNTSPRVGEQVTFTLSALGGRAPYQFLFYPQNGSSRFGGESPNNLATATTDFDSAGYRNPTLTVWSSDGKVGSCSSSLYVRSAPTVSIVASPSSSVPIGSQMTVTASPSDFLNNNTGVTYSFSSDNASVVVAQTGNQATVHATGSVFQSAKITVTATSGSESAQASLDVYFAESGFSCQLSAVNISSTQPAFVGDDITVRLTSSAGRAVEITQFNVGSGGVLLSAQSDPLLVRYNTAGDKVIQLSARDALTKTPCNLNGSLQLALRVNQPVSCTASVPTAAPNGVGLLAQAIIPTGYGSSPSNIRITEITSSVGSGIQVPAGQYGLAWYISFDNGGTFPVNIKVKDFGDPQQREATCSATHTSHLYTPICRVSFRNMADQIISTLRAHNRVKIRVESNLSPANQPYLSLNAGAVTNGSIPSGYFSVPSFPYTSPILRYTQNVTGTITSAALVHGVSTAWPYGDIYDNCSSQLVLTAPLSCTLSKSLSRVLADNTFDFISQGEQGSLSYSDAPYGPNGFVPAKSDITINAQNPQGTVRYELNVSNGLAPDVQSTTNASVVIPGKFFANGLYPIKNKITDTEDDLLGNSCELNDVNKLDKVNRLIVDSRQRILFTIPTGTTTFACKVRMVNRGNRDNRVTYSNPFNAAYAGTAAHILPGAERYLTLYKSGNRCGITVQAAGDFRYSTSHTYPDGANAFDLQLEVDYTQNGILKHVSIPLRQL